MEYAYVYYNSKLPKAIVFSSDILSSIDARIADMRLEFSPGQLVSVIMSLSKLDITYR
jgi:hypothetical protein